MYRGNTEIIPDGVDDYIRENIGKMQTSEMCAQIVQILNGSGDNVTQQDVQTHIENHMVHREVVIGSLISDLLSLSRASRRACMVVCEETGESMPDSKNEATYLKTVDTLLRVVAQDSSRSARAARD